MSIELSFQNGPKALLRTPTEGEAISLSPGVGGSHRMLLNLAAKAISGAPRFTAVVLDGEVYAVPATGGERWVGTLGSSTLTLDSAEEFTRSLHLPLTLSTEQLLGLEGMFAGQDLHFRLHVEARMDRTGDDFPLAESQGAIRVPASTWQRQLVGVGRAVGFLVSVPLRMEAGVLREAAKHLQSAHTEIIRGHWNDAVRESRLGLEEMRNSKHWPPAPNKPVAQRTMSERYAAALQAQFDLASGVQHTGPAQTEGPVTRADAVSIHGQAVSLFYKLVDVARV